MSILKISHLVILPHFIFIFNRGRMVSKQGSSKCIKGWIHYCWIYWLNHVCFLCLSVASTEVTKIRFVRLTHAQITDLLKSHWGNDLTYLNSVFLSHSGVIRNGNVTRMKRTTCEMLNIVPGKWQVLSQGEPLNKLTIMMNPVW